jgi:hypothetical protein
VPRIAARTRTRRGTSQRPVRPVPEGATAGPGTPARLTRAAVSGSSRGSADRCSRRAARPRTRRRAGHARSCPGSAGSCDPPSSWSCARAVTAPWRPAGRCSARSTRHQRRVPDRSERHELDAVAELGRDAGRERDGQPGLARAAGPGQRQQPGAVQEAARRAEFALPADEARPRPRHATGCLAGIRGPKTYHLSSPRHGDERPPAECAGAPRFDGLTDSGPRTVRAN